MFEIQFYEFINQFHVPNIVVKKVMCDVKCILIRIQGNDQLRHISKNKFLITVKLVSSQNYCHCDHNTKIITK